MMHLTATQNHQASPGSGTGRSGLACVTLLAVVLTACGARIVEDGKQADSAHPEADTTRTVESLPEAARQELTAEDDNRLRDQPASSSSQSDPKAPTGDVSAVVNTPTGQSTRRQAVTAEARFESVQSHVVTPLIHPGPHVDRENYDTVRDNPVHLVAEQPVSTFSIDVDTAGYSNLRRMLLREGRLPPRDAVRLEEMINYFDYAYPAPQDAGEPLAVHTEMMPAPWHEDRQLLMVGLKGYQPPAEQRPAANLVFLVDVSGSMRSPDKLGLVKRSLALLVEQMDESDRIALVVYAGAAGMVLDSTSGGERRKILAAVDSLTAGGSTNGAAGIELAYQIAERNLIEGGINRVIIASDGDLNVGLTNIDALKEMVARKRANGVALTTLGFGSGNYNYSLMEQIADVGNGNAAYIDSLNEARKVLIEQMQSTLLTIASDVKIQIEFNPAVVKEYRLIGYENRLLEREDFVNDRVDAGEIGAGHTVTALYELTLVQSEAGYLPPLRYAGEQPPEPAGLSAEMAYVKIRYKLPQQQASTEMATAILAERPGTGGSASDNLRFAAAVAGFGELLRGGKYAGSLTYEQLLELARGARGDDPHGYRSELLNMIEIARLL